MFVKIKNYKDNEDNTIILNIDRISSIRNSLLPDKDCKNSWILKSDTYLAYYKHFEDKYTVIMDTKDEYILNQEQYEQICKVLESKIAK